MTALAAREDLSEVMASGDGVKAAEEPRKRNRLPESNPAGG